MFKSSLLFIALVTLLLCLNVQAGTVYKKVNKDGSVEYSDKPFKDAKAVIIPNQQQSQLPSLAPVIIPTYKHSNKTNASNKITITMPKHGATIRNNNGNFTIMVQKVTKTKQQPYTQISINGIAYKKPSQGNVFKVKNIDRGEVTIQAKLLNNSGNVLATSLETVIYLHRVSNIKVK